MIAPPAAAVAIVLHPTRSTDPCARPHIPARLAKQPSIDVPADAVPNQQYREVRILVTLDRAGKALSARVFKASGAPKFDTYMLGVAKGASYAPEIVHCKPVAAQYFYVVEYGEGTPAPTVSH